MRVSRTQQLSSPDGYVHKFWRCHNKEFYLSNDRDKDLYFQAIMEALTPQVTDNNVKVHAFCAMDNHFHQVVEYSNGSKWLSYYMRQAHSLFGARYNKSRGRSGKVAEGRPKTPLVEDIDHLMRVQFYVEANPVRAGKLTLEMLKNYKYSSYGYYAYGIETKYTKILHPPDWYLDLGKTPKERQRKYRKLFREYVSDQKTKFENFMDLFIGSQLWRLNQAERVKKLVLAKKSPAEDSS